MKIRERCKEENICTRRRHVRRICVRREIPPRQIDADFISNVLTQKSDIIFHLYDKYHVKTEFHITAKCKLN